MLPGVRKKIADEKVQSLTPDERTLLDTPREKLKPEQFEKRAAVEAKVQVTDRDVADRIAKEQPAKANDAEQLRAELAERTESDVERGFTGHGPHRDDVVTLRAGRELQGTRRRKPVCGGRELLSLEQLGQPSPDGHGQRTPRR